VTDECLDLRARLHDAVTLRRIDLDDVMLRSGRKPPKRTGSHVLRREQVFAGGERRHSAGSRKQRVVERIARLEPAQLNGASAG
jgi:hypothetical protein